LIANGIPLTQRNWIEAAYLGDKYSIGRLSCEELADAQEGFEEWPVDVTSGQPTSSFRRVCLLKSTT